MSPGVRDCKSCRPDQLGQLAYLGIQVLASVLGAEDEAPLHVTAPDEAQDGLPASAEVTIAPYSVLRVSSKSSL